MTRNRRWRSGGLLGAAVAGLMMLRPGPVLGADKLTGDTVTDEDVVASMHRGIDYLLSVKKGDNWEISHPELDYKGGETSIVLYALLHAGESLQDDPDYHAKLHWRGKDMLPAIEWLEKNKPASTYVAGLETCALTLVPKLPNLKPGEGPQLALDSCKEYVIEAMGHDGGYTYVSRLYNYTTGVPQTIAELWDAYCAAMAKKNATLEKSLKDEVDGYMKAMSGQVGGEQWAVQSLAADLRNESKTAATPAEAAKYDTELKALEIYSRILPPPPPPDNPQADLAQAKKHYDDLEGYKRTGQMPDPKDAKKMVRVTPDEIDKLIADQKERVEVMEAAEKTNFAPMGDLSNAQYGTLAAWGLLDYGMELPNAYWTRSDRFWRLMQNPDGGWPYDALKRGDLGVTTDSMGVVGIASLFICQEFVDTELRLIPKPDKNIDAGLAWLNKSYKPETGSMYYMYSVERVGLSSGLKFFGTTDWYKEGAAAVINRQNANGSWGDTVDTSYALLFLSRGRNPVVFNKLQYKGPWNARPRDDAYVTRWMSKRFEKPINWQSVNLQVSSDEWLDAPILLITGSQDPKFTAEDMAKLRAYVNAGGMIFSSSDGNTVAFTTAMKKYAAELCDKKYEWRQLPKTHALFSKEMSAELPNPPMLFGMSNGVRELWIHSPQDVGADWQTRKFSSKNFDLGAALYFYASGMGSLRSKLQPLAVRDDSAIPARTLAVAAVDYSGNSDPEPGAFGRLAKLARARLKMQVNVATVKFADLDPKKTPLAHLTGTTHVTFTDDEVKGLKAYLDGGGLLFVDSAGGGPDFADSARELIKKACPDAALAPLPADSPIYTGSMPDGVKLATTDFRKFGNIRLQRRVTAPALESVEVNGRTKVIFSEWDVSSGFLGTNTWGIMGYAPATSEVLGENILLYAMNPVAAPAGAK